MRPHLERGIRAGEHRGDLYTAWSAGDLRGDHVHRPDTLLTIVRDSGGEPYKVLVAEVAKTTPARLYWGRQQQNLFIERALELISQGASADVAADALLKDLNGAPPTRRLAFRTYGFAPQHRVDVAGVSFWFRGDQGLEVEMHGAEDTLKRAWGGGRPIYNNDGLAIVTALGDGERAVQNGLVRVRVAISILACIAAAGPVHQHEVDFGLGDTDYGEALWIDQRYVFVTEGPEDLSPRRWMHAEQSEVQEEIAQRPGLRALVALSDAIPVDEASASKLDLRLLRAVSALSVSFEGPPAERLLWRWIAIEALLGEGRAEIAERLADNVAVLTADEPQERPRRKREVKTLYDLRSAVAHGGSVEAPDSDAVARLRSYALMCLERVASVRDLGSFDHLRDALEIARFQAFPFDQALKGP